MSVVENYDRYKKFNPSSIAESIAKSRAGGEAAREQSSATGQGHDQANRAARVTESIAPAAGEASGGEKRKAEEVAGDVDMEDEAKTGKMQRTE